MFFFGRTQLRTVVPADCCGADNGTGLPLRSPHPPTFPGVFRRDAEFRKIPHPSATAVPETDSPPAGNPSLFRHLPVLLSSDRHIHIRRPESIGVSPPDLPCRGYNGHSPPAFSLCKQRNLRKLVITTESNGYKPIYPFFACSDRYSLHFSAQIVWNFCFFVVSCIPEHLLNLKYRHTQTPEQLGKIPFSREKMDKSNHPSR